MASPNQHRNRDDEDPEAKDRQERKRNEFFQSLRELSEEKKIA